MNKIKNIFSRFKEWFVDTDFFARLVIFGPIFILITVLLLAKSCYDTHIIEEYKKEVEASNSDCFSSGWDSGYEFGYREGKSDASGGADYNDGYEDGYKAAYHEAWKYGYDNGYKAGKNGDSFNDTPWK